MELVVVQPVSILHAAEPAEDAYPSVGAAVMYQAVQPVPKPGP